MPSLTELGWDTSLAQAFAEILADLDGPPAAGSAPERAAAVVPARVAVRHGKSYLLLAEEPHRDLRAEVTGRMLHQAAGASERLPATGDWVAVEPFADGAGRIRALLPRRGKISRAAAGGTSDEQVLAAHVDLALVVMPLGREPLRLRRLERSLAVARRGGIDAVVVLTKADLSASLERDVDAARSVSGGAPVLPVTAPSRAGVAELCALLAPEIGPSPTADGTVPRARTAVLLGASGAGKSTLVNALADDQVAEVQEVRRDGKGRHTTTHRELMLLPGGGCIIDTPGVREIGLWDAGPGDEDADGGGAAGVADTFEDLEQLAARCRFGDCSHDVEPGCAVLAAMESGEVDPGRVASWAKLARELQWIERRHDERARHDQKRAARVLSRAVREVMRVKGRQG